MVAETLSLRQLIIKQSPFSGDSVVYVMSRDQRTHDNHALAVAQAFALEQNAPLYVLFVLKNIPNRSREHYEFMLEGLKDVSDTLAAHNIPFIIRSGDASEQIPQFCEEVDAGALCFDFSPLSYARKLAKVVANNFEGPVTVVDTHNIIPAWVVSDKQEYAAHTMRTKVHKHLERFLDLPAKLQDQPKPEVLPTSMSLDEAKEYVQSIPLSGIKLGFKAGQIAAQSRLEEFIGNDLATYALNRNNIADDHQSGLSPYLHFGQISSLRVALEIMDAVKQPPLLLLRPKLAEHGDQPSLSDGMNALLEEMIVRKELADNFCLFAEDYQSIVSVPAWAQNSLAAHSTDARDFIYDTEAWESAATHDEIWNAAQQELTKCGKMHGYMRMYWAKKILEWSVSPEEAVKTAIYLNDKYSIDGGDPNGYVGILWSIAGLHDRPWFERPVFGQIRYMNDSGLRRKFDVDGYIDRVKSL